MREFKCVGYKQRIVSGFILHLDFFKGNNLIRLAHNALSKLDLAVILSSHPLHDLYILVSMK